MGLSCRITVPMKVVGALQNSDILTHTQIIAQPEHKLEKMNLINVVCQKLRFICSEFSSTDHITTEEVATANDSCVDYI